MKTKRVLIGVLIAALVLAFIPIYMEAYYVAVALIVGVLIMGHRELWSLITKRKLPPIDERVRANVGRSIRNALVFFAVAIVSLMLLFSVNRDLSPDILNLLGALFLSVGVVYLLSYLFYDRSQPNLGERGLKMLKTFLLIAGISLGVFIISFFLHNVISGIFDIEEAVFFCIAVFVAPAGFAVGLIGGLVIFLKGLFSRPV
jgi:hypothetical protein